MIPTNKIVSAILLIAFLAGVGSLLVTPVLVLSQPPDGGPGVTNPTWVYTLNVNDEYTLPSTDGSASQILQTDGAGGVTWENNAAGFSDPMTTRGDLIYKNSGGTTTRLPAGTNTYVLTSDGADISWAAPSGGGTTQEQVDDWVDALINDADSVHTRVTITYDDTDNAMDFVVDAESDPTALLTAGTDNVKDTHIDWGTGAGQVSAVDVPIADAGALITGTEVETALQENRTAINLNTSKVTESTTVGDTATLDLTLSTYDITGAVLPGGVDHDSLLNFVANEHLDWTQDLGATNIHAGNYTDSDTTYTAGDALTLTANDFDFDGGASPGGELGGTWASPTVDSGIHDDEYVEVADAFIGDVTGPYSATVVGDDSHAHTTTSISGLNEADISDLAHTATAITDGLIIEPDLDADTTPDDADILTYDSTGTNFDWITPNAGTDVTADLEEEGAINTTAVTGNAVDNSTLIGTGASAAAYQTLPSCSDEAETLGFNTSTGAWVCNADAGAGGGMTSWTVQADDTNTMTVSDGETVDVAGGLGLKTTAATGSPEQLTVDWDYSQTLAGNPALGIDECIFTTDGTGGGVLCEGTTADTNETLLEFKDAGADITITLPAATDTLVGKATTDTFTNKTIDASNTVTINASDITDLSGSTDITADLEEETHASEHAVSGADTVFPADPNADRYLMWDDDPGNLSWETVASAGATTALDNLASVAINTTLISDTAATDDLGTEALYWRKLYIGSDISFEGSTDDGFQTTLTVTDPTTPDKTITLPDATGTVILSGHTFSGDVTTTLEADGDSPLVVVDDSHAHTTTTLSGIDIGDDTNLAGTANEITLTGDTLSLVLLKDVVTTAPLTGAADNILVGADSDLILAMPAATTSQDGYITQTDWDTFNDHAADSTQAHSDYLLNTGADTAGAGAGFAWTFDASAGTDSIITFGDGVVNVSAGELQEGGVAVLTAETDPNALLTAGTNNVNDTHIDWGSGANQVDIDDIADSATYKRVAAAELAAGIYKDATVSVKGIASFADADFTVTTGAVTIDDKFLLHAGDVATGVHDFGGADSFELPNSATPTVNATGEIALDTTITGWTTGLWRYYDSDEELAILAVPSAQVDTPPTDDYVVAYDAATDELYFKQDADMGANTPWDDIGNPDADGSIAFAGYEQTITSTLDEAAHSMLILDHTDADVTNATTILKIQSVDDADADLTYIQIVDASGGTPNTVFSVADDGDTTVEGTVQTGADGLDGLLNIYSEQGGTDYNVSFKPHATMTEATDYVLPAADGTADQVLTTDGSENLSWSTASGGGSSRWTDEATFSRTDDNTISITPASADCTNWEVGTPLRFSSSGAPTTFYYAVVDTCTDVGATINVDIFGHPIETDKDDNLEYGIPEVLSHIQLIGVGNCSVSDTWFPKYYWSGQDANIVGAWLYLDTQATGTALELNIEHNGTNALDTEFSIAVSTTMQDIGTTVDDTTYANALIEQEEFIEISVSQCGSTIPGGNAAWIKLVYATP